MTPAQRNTVAQLKVAGFELVTESAEIVRMTKGADRRIVFADGSQKRAHHAEHRRA